VGVLSAGGFAHGFQALLEGGGVSPQGAVRHLGGECLNRFLNGEDRKKIFRASVAHTSAPKGRMFDKSERFELTQSLANGGLAEVELAGEPRLDESFSRSVGAVEP
jgi:hypothetical protein